MISLLAFQVAPVQVVKDANGQLEIAVGYGAEHYLQQAFDCNGTAVRERSVQARIVSGIVDYRSSGPLHVSAFGGHASADVGACSNLRDGYPESDCYFGAPFAGGFGGFVVSSEGRRFGFGAGVVAVPHTPYDEGGLFPGIAKHTAIQPSMQLRIGNRERVQLLLDVNTVRAPGEALMSTVGVGFGRPNDVTQRGFMGVGLLPYNDVGNDGAVAVIGRGAIPVSSTFDVVLGGYFGAGSLIGGHAGARWRVPLGH